MHDLQLVGFTTDRRGLIFRTTAGARPESYIVPVTDELVALVRSIGDAGAVDPAAVEAAPPGAGDDAGAGADRASVGGPRAESQLSVREIQARLRAGEDVARVAREAGVDDDWIERFAPPVRAEQGRIVERALASHLERPRAGSSVVPLRRAVGMALADKGIAFTAAAFEAAWSSRLVGHDRWAVQFRYRHRGKERTAVWDFDATDGSLTTADRTASQLGFVGADGHHDPDAGAVIDGVIGDPAATPIGTAPPPRRRTTPQRRSERTPGDEDANGAAPAPAKASRKAGASSATTKRTPARAAAGKKPGAKKASPKRTAKKARATKVSATKAGAKAASATKAAPTAAPTKAAATKAAATKAAVTKAAAPKAAVTKGAAPKAAPKEAATGASRPNVRPKKAAATKAAATKAPATKATAGEPRAAATKQIAAAEAATVRSTPPPTSPPTSPAPRSTSLPAGSARPTSGAAASNGATRSTAGAAPATPVSERPSANGAPTGAGGAAGVSALGATSAPAPAPAEPAPAGPAPDARRRTVQVETRRGADGPPPVPGDPGEPANPEELLRVRARRVEERLSQDARAASRPPSGSTGGAHLADAARTDPPAVPRPWTADAELEADRTAARRARAAERNAHTVQFRSGAAAPVRVAGEGSVTHASGRTPGAPASGAPRPAPADGTPPPPTPPVDANGAARPRTRRRRQLRAR